MAKKQRFFGVFALLVLLFAAGLALVRGGSAAGQSPEATPAAGEAAGPANAGGIGNAGGSPNADQNFVQGLRQALSSGRLSEPDRQLLQKKLELNQRLADQRAAPSTARGPKGTLVAPVPMPSPQNPSEPVERIIPGSEGLVHSWEASINNLWEGLYQDTPYQILAGAAPDEPAQGVLIVIAYPSSSAMPVRSTYRSPSPAGALSIVERQGSRLRCTAAGGSILYFDLETRAFQP